MELDLSPPESWLWRQYLIVIGGSGWYLEELGQVKHSHQLQLPSMPLPPALAARLAKRGILSTPKEPEPEPAASTEEEIIAEDYDDTPQHQPTPLLLPHHLPASHTTPEPQTIDPHQGWAGCPNKWNVYHECSVGCRERWGDGGQVDAEYARRRLKMLAKYPLPSHWQEVLDPGIRRYYYWNTETDLVSWLPPGHPRCQVSRPAAVLRREMAVELAARKEEEEEEGDEEVAKGEQDDQMSDKSEGSGDEGGGREMVRTGVRRRDSKDRRKDRRVRAEPELDPMDPASYGECGRGTWSSGLPQRNEARTGADVTANGPLFQMRPYPSPGAVLRANAAAGPIGPKKA